MVSMPSSSTADRRSSLRSRNGSSLALANAVCCFSESVLMPATAIPASRSRRWPATSASIAFMPLRFAAPERVGAPKNSRRAGCFVTKLRRLSR